jgi:hypothetical protein
MILKKNGVKIISAMENISEGSEGIILEAMLEGFAEYYSAELAEKIGRGLTENALKGRINGDALPMGYVVNEERNFEIDETGAAIVHEVFNRYFGGEKMAAIAKDLTRRGIRSSRGNALRIDAIHHTLKNRRYIGEYSFRNITKPNAFPAIVSKELFDRVQEIMAKNAKTPARHKAEDDYFLTTKLRCGKCGAFMVGESGTGRSGTVHHYYKCVNTKKRKTCGKKPVKKLWIENIVLQQAMKVIMDDVAIGKIADAILNLVGQENTLLPQLKARLKDIEDGIQNMLDAIQQGVLTSSTKQRLTELEESKTEIQTAILSEELQKPELTREHILFWITKFRGIDLTDLDSRKRLIDGFVSAVSLYDDKLVLAFNYKDGTKSVSLSELEGIDKGTETFDGTSGLRYTVLENMGGQRGSDLVDLSPPVSSEFEHPIHFRKGCGRLCRKKTGVGQGKELDCFVCIWRGSLFSVSRATLIYYGILS